MKYSKALKIKGVFVLFQSQSKHPPPYTSGGKVKVVTSQAVVDSPGGLVMGAEVPGQLLGSTLAGVAGLPHQQTTDSQTTQKDEPIGCKGPYSQARATGACSVRTIFLFMA